MKDLAESYSELVPGKLGIKTFGFGTFDDERLTLNVEVKVSASLVEGAAASG